jgi:two-component system response regulator AtoC
MRRNTEEVTESSAPVGTVELPVDGHQFYVGTANPAMRAIERVIADIAPTDIPVLLLGESGTGKEVVAMRIHQLSHRHEEPFLKLSCAALTPGTFTQHLLTGNSNGQGGNGSSGRGSIFLDEVSELDLACQPKLLLALPDGDNGPSGSPLGARLICATSRNLEEEMRAGRFRDELYFRINGVCLRLPPLRHRREDVPVLFEHFLRKYARQMGRPVPLMQVATLAALMQHAWPGNIRELENVARKVVALGNVRVALADLGGPRRELEPSTSGAEGVSLKDAARAASRQAERELILRTLAKTRWNRKRAAQELQISYKALLYKLKQIGLDESGAA